MSPKRPIDKPYAEPFANREEPLPTLVVESEQASTNGTATPADGPGSAPVRGLSASRLKAKLEDTGLSKNGIQDRLFNSLFAQIFPEHDYDEATSKTDKPSRQYVGKPQFSLPRMSDNFRRFNARIGVVFVFQDPICLMSIMVPAFMARHPPPPSADLTDAFSTRGPAIAPPRTVKPAPEMSKDFFRNMRDLQNSMDDFAVIHDKLVAMIAPLTNFSDEKLSSTLFLGLMVACCTLFIAAGLIPFRLVFLLAGWAVICSSHPVVLDFTAGMSQKRVKAHQSRAKIELENWVESDIVLDEEPEKREVEVFELQRQRDTEWEHWLYSVSPFDPLYPARIGGDRPKGARFFEDVQPPEGWAANQHKRTKNSIFARQKQHFARARSNIRATSPDISAFRPSYLTENSDETGFDAMSVRSTSSRRSRQTRLEEYDETSALASRLSRMRNRSSRPAKHLRQISLNTLLPSTKGNQACRASRSTHWASLATKGPPTKEDYRVEKLLHCRLQHDRIEYEVVWAGYEDTTWEPEETLALEVPNLIRAFKHEYGNSLAYHDNDKLLQTPVMHDLDRKRHQLLQCPDWLRINSLPPVPMDGFRSSQHKPLAKRRQLNDKDHLRLDPGGKRLRVPSVREDWHLTNDDRAQSLPRERAYIRSGLQTVVDDRDMSLRCESPPTSRHSTAVTSDTDCMLLDTEIADSTPAPLPRGNVAKSISESLRHITSNLQIQPGLKAAQTYFFHSDLVHNDQSASQGKDPEFRLMFSPAYSLLSTNSENQSLNPNVGSSELSNLQIDVCDNASRNADMGITASEMADEDRWATYVNAPPTGSDNASDIARNIPSGLTNSQRQRVKDQRMTPVAGSNPGIQPLKVLPANTRVVRHESVLQSREKDEQIWRAFVFGRSSSPCKESFTLDGSSELVAANRSSMKPGTPSSSTPANNQRATSKKLPKENSSSGNGNLNLSSFPGPLSTNNELPNVGVDGRVLPKMTFQRPVLCSQRGLEACTDDQSVVVHVGGRRRRSSSNTIVPGDALHDEDEIDDF
ncbi:hypothetical protein FH972_021841 [Carpinus fangiana]|uniref:Chromo domain-containing protein n=1 Tax=Carpinus fangiana TaxID=176857 RepID=A0A5N6KR27_9ROSI|nr:hypothetical protein FH972_021841 [Carpinus fangiana]